MNDVVKAAAERLVNATNLADDSLTDFEAAVKTVARFALEAADRQAALAAELGRLREANEMLMTTMETIAFAPVETPQGYQNLCNAARFALEEARAALDTAPSEAPGASDAGEGERR